MLDVHSQTSNVVSIEKVTLFQHLNPSNVKVKAHYYPDDHTLVAGDDIDEAASLTCSHV